ncbi:MAG: PaaI family thioesterase, partial [Candidatus Methanomethylophilaceae archaeon]|nr:PaaI family thioesterase [Candidatus Methanomethylophilaceae archaeon]
MGRGHGAAIYALMDHTFAIACNISSDSTGQSSEIKYYRPASGKLTAIAEPINRSRSLEVYSVRAVSEEGKLIASATCTSFIIKKRERTREGPV